MVAFFGFLKRDNMVFGEKRDVEEEQGIVGRSSLVLRTTLIL